MRGSAVNHSLVDGASFNKRRVIITVCEVNTMILCTRTVKVYIPKVSLLLVYNSVVLVNLVQNLTNPKNLTCPQRPHEIQRANNLLDQKKAS